MRTSCKVMMSWETRVEHNNSSSIQQELQRTNGDRLLVRTTGRQSVKPCYQGIDASEWRDMHATLEFAKIRFSQGQKSERASRTNKDKGKRCNGIKKRGSNFSQCGSDPAQVVRICGERQQEEQVSERTEMSHSSSGPIDEPSANTRTMCLNNDPADNQFW